MIFLEPNENTAVTVSFHPEGNRVPERTLPRATHIGLGLNTPCDYKGFPLKWATLPGEKRLATGMHFHTHQGSGWREKGISKHEFTEPIWYPWYCCKHRGTGESGGPFCPNGFIICRNITYIPGTSDGKRVIRSVTNCTGAGQLARGSAAPTSEQSILGGGGRRKRR